MFRTTYVFRGGGRPVFYEKTNVAKKLLHDQEWWRIVNYNLSDPKHLIDWTHEREWRVPDDFTFDISQAMVVVPSTTAYRTFHRTCVKLGLKVADQVKAVIPLGPVFF